MGESAGRWRRWVLRLAAVGIVCLAAGSVFAVATVRSVLADAAWIGAARADVEDATGLRITFEGMPVVRLLPRPRLVVDGVHIAADSGLAAHAGSVEGVIALLPLLRGTVMFDRIRLDDVTGTLDADAVAHDFHHGRAADAATDGGADGTLPDRVTIVSGFLHVRSRTPGGSGFLSDLHLVADGIRDGTTLSGGATWHGEKAEFSARMDSLARFLRSEPAKGMVRVKSPALTGTLSGTWSDGWRGGFAGSVSAASPDFPALMRIVGAVPGPLAGVRTVGVAATAEPSPNGLALTAARLTVNGSVLEGTLGVEMSNGRPVVVGTLATSELDLDPILASQPALRDGTGAWSSEPAPFVLGDLRDIDVRVSAGRIRLKTLVAEDAAVSVLSSDGRQELSLGEARAYGGLIKARLTTSGGAAGVAAKLDASWSQLDLARLAEAAGLTSGGLSGAASGHVALEGVGTDIAGLVRSLEGRGQASLIQVDAGAAAVAALMRASGGPKIPSTRLAFDLASFDYRVSRGVAEVDKGLVSSPDYALDVTGTASLIDRTYAMAARPGGDADTGTEPMGDAAWRITGRWGGTMHWSAPKADSVLPKPARRDTRLMP